MDNGSRHFPVSSKRPSVDLHYWLKSAGRMPIADGLILAIIVVLTDNRVTIYSIIFL